MRNQNNNEQNLLSFIFSFLYLLWSKRKFILIITGCFFVGSLIYVLLAQPYYEAEISLYKFDNQETSIEGGGMQGIISQFGMSEGGSDFQFSIGDVVDSKFLRKKLIHHKWDSTSRFDQPVDLITYFNVDGETAKKKEYNLLKKLDDLIEYEHNEETGLYIIMVLMPEPELATEIAAYIPSIIKDYINNKHKLKVRNDLNYIDKRYQQLNEELKAVEAEYKKFRQRNMLVGRSPDLQLELERLERKLNLKEQVYLTLKQEREKAMIELVKKTPVINVLDEPIVPFNKEKPKRKLIVFISTIIGGIVSLLLIRLSYFFNLISNNWWKLKE